MIKFIGTKLKDMNVVNDLNMPDISGEKMANEIIQVRTNIPILLCTGHSDRKDENKAMELGIKAFVIKTIGKADPKKMSGKCWKRPKAKFAINYPSKNYFWA